MIRFTCLACSACTALAIARYVLPVPAGPIANTIVCLSIASTYCFWFSVFGRIVRPRFDRMFSVSTSAGRVSSAERNMLIDRSTASSVSGCPVRSTSTISPNSFWISSTSPRFPVTVISLPRTWMSASGNAFSITFSNASPEPSRLTIVYWAGMTIF